MKLSKNVMINKLLELINDGHHLVRISVGGSIPPKVINYYLDDGTVQKLELEMTADEYKAADKAMRSWCGMLKKLEIME